MGARPRSDRLVTSLLAGGAMVFALTQTMVVPLLTPISGSTGAGQAALSWMVTAPLVAAAALAPLLGRLADVRGKKMVLVIILIAMAAGGLLVATTDGPGWIIAGRALQGFGGAFVPISVALLRDLVEERAFVAGVALLSSSLGLGVAMGIPVASALAEVVDWRAVFLVVAVLTLAILVGVVVLVSDRGLRHAGERLDVVGGTVLAVLLAVLMATVTGLGEWGILDVRTAAGVAIAVVGGMVWTRVELRREFPIIDLRLAARPEVVLVNVIAFFAGYALFSGTLVTTKLVQNPPEAGWGFGLTVAQSGFVIATGGLAMLVFSQVARHLIARFGSKATIIAGGVVMAAGYVVQLLVPTLPGTLVAVLIVNAGLALPFAALPVLVTRSVDSRATGSANSINMLARNVGQAVSSAVVGALAVAWTIGVGEGDAMAPAGLVWGFAIALAASAMSAALGLYLPARRPDR
jgi:MFS family permease